MRRSIVLTGVLASATLFASTALAATPATPAPPTTTSAAAPLPIGPEQLFSGLVNGSSGSAVIRMVCPGPIVIGGTGHPLPGQTVSVQRLLPPASADVLGFGFTGDASTIAATLELPSVTPADATAAATAGIPLAVFAFYGQPMEIPTTLTLPCSGKGVVVYAPVQGGPNSRSNTVDVTFGNVAASS